MVAETARKFEALEGQAQRLLSVFTSEGYEAVAPAIIQPADVFLDVVGESLRSRTYVFTDPDGQELCLRPDLTVPTCRLYLERHPEANVAARYCYNGPAFRFQPSGASSVHPSEFRQAGIECFAETDREKAETEVVSVIVQALRAAGLERFSLRIGDLGLFRTLLETLAIPPRWRERLRHHFWRPETFRAEVRRLTSNPAEALEDLPAELISALDPDDPQGAEALVDSYLEQHGLELIGVRTVREIASNLLAIVADAKGAPMSPASADVIETYLRIDAPAPAAATHVEGLMSRCSLDLGEA